MAEDSGGVEGQHRLPWLVATTAAGLAGVLLAVGLWGAVGGARQAAAVPPPASPPDGGPPAATVPATTVPATRAEQPAHQQAAGRDGAPGQPAVGECLTGVDGAVAAVVDCALTHLFEVVGLVDAPSAWRTRPSDLEWRTLLEIRCPDLLRAHVGPTHDPYGILTLRVSAPSASEWEAGDRTGECLASVGSDDGGRPLPFAGAVAQIDQSPSLSTGTCVDTVTRPGAPRAVPCSVAHQLEVTGPLDLTGRFEHYPTGEEWATLDRSCPDLGGADAVGGRSSSPGGSLVGTAVRIPVASWLAGRRDSACAVAEIGSDGRVVSRVASDDTGD